jgi:glycosyltransferase involved in cell wall biosynthesis
MTSGMTEMLSRRLVTNLSTPSRSSFFGKKAYDIAKPGTRVGKAKPMTNLNIPTTSKQNTKYNSENKLIKLKESNYIAGDLMKLVVFIPAFNEEKNISSVIKGVPRHIDRIDWVDVLVVDDGSADKTTQASWDAGANKVVTLNRNKGLGFAFKTGVKNALEMGADIMVMIDGDGQFNPSDIGKIVQPILNGEADMVTCSRFLDKKTMKKWPMLKRLGNSMFTKVVNSLTKNNFTDTQCGFRAFTRDALKNLTIYGNFNCSQETFLDLCRKNYRIKEMALEVTYDKKRKSRIAGNIFKYGIMVGINIIRAIRDYGPLTFFGTAGLSVFMAGVIAGLYIMTYSLRTGEAFPHIKYTILTGVLLITGFQLIILALLADMLGRQRRLLEEIHYKQQT